MREATKKDSGNNRNPNVVNVSQNEMNRPNLRALDLVVECCLPKRSTIRQTHEGVATREILDRSKQNYCGSEPEAPYATKARIRVGKMSTPQIATEAQAIDTQAMTMGGHPKASRHRRTS